MEADKGKVLQNANQLAAKGQFDKAIAEWRKLLADSPNDGSIHNNIGDLHLKRNATDEAIDAYLQAGAAFHAAGSALKAIAVYKKILKLDPSRYGVYQQLGDLNAERGLVNNAIADYVTLGKLYLRDGRVREALAVYRKIVALDPTSLASRQRLAELCLQENQRDEAIKAYFQLGKEAVAQGHIDQARKAYETILKLDAGNAKAAKLLKDPQSAIQDVKAEIPSLASTDSPLDQAQQRIEAGDYDDAERLLSDLLSAQPGDPQVCRLLAMLHLRRGELGIALSEIQFLSEAAIRAEDYALAESMITDYLKADPQCVSLLELLGSLYERKGDPATAVVHYGKAVMVLLAQPDPEAPSRHTELFNKMKALGPESPAVADVATALAAPGATRVDVETTPSALPASDGEPSVQPDPVAVEAKASGQGARPELELALAPVFDAGEPAVQEEEPASFTAQPMPLRLVDAAIPDPVMGSGENAPAASPTQVEEPNGTPVVEIEPQPVAVESKPPGPTEHDYRVRFELGMAYKNMGMLAEAVEELRFAVNGRECFLEAASMLAASFKEQGLLEPAMECLEQALADPRCEKDKTIPVRYELGVLYETGGLLEKARNLYGTIPTFLDVPIRLERLQGGTKIDAGEVDMEAGSATAAAGPGTVERKKRRISYL
ncbi:tetratricopeptide repeat protein [Candidatus Nitrospira bockiana]